MNRKTMKKILILTAVLLLFYTNVFADTYVNEYRTIGATYETWGDGDNYDTGGGVYAPSNKAVKSSGNNFIVDEVGLPWSISKNSREITYTRGEQDTTFVFSGMYWFNTATEAWTQIDSENNVTPTQVGDTVVASGLYDGVDLEIISSVSGPQVDYVITDMSGWTPNPYGTDGVLAFWHELKNRGHGLEVDGISWNGTDLAFGNNVTFTGTVRDFDIINTLAEDATGDKANVTNAIIRAVNKDFFGESVDATWVASATLPVRMHYETKNGTISSDATWGSGTTYYLDADVTIANEVTLTVEGGAVVKGGSPTIAIKGGGQDAVLVTSGASMTNFAYFTAKDDNSVGAEIDGSDGEPDTPGFGGIGEEANAFQINLDGAYIGYALNPVWVKGDGLTDISITLTNSYIYWNSGSVGVKAQTTGTGSNLDFHVNNCIFYTPANVTSTGVVYTYWLFPAPITSEFHIENNLFYIDAIPYDPIAVIWTRGHDSFKGVDVIIRNNTVFCTENVGDTRGIYSYTPDITTTTVQDNIVVGCTTGYLTNAVGETDLIEDHNLAYNNGTDWGNGFGGGTGDITTTPDFGTHDDAASGVPEWANDYHLGTSTTAVDAGSRSSSAAGLDALHTVVAATTDSGDVDLGFHFPVATPVGGGITCSNSGWYTGTEIESLRYICGQLSLTGCDTEFVAIKKIVENIVEETYDYFIGESEFLRVWCYELREELIAYSYTEVESLRCIVQGYTGDSYPVATEAELLRIIADCSPFE